MKNRFWGLNSAGIILWCATAAAAQGVPCEIAFLDNPDGTFDAPSKEACASMLSYRPAFAALLRAASFEEGQVALKGQFDPSDNAYFDFRENFVGVHTGKIKKYPNPEPALLFTLAHEVGHAVQRRGGEMAWRYSAGTDTPQGHERSRAMEAHADAIAADLLEKAGLADSKAIVTAQETRFGCPSLQGDPAPVTTHPANRDRFLHQLKRVTLSGPAVSPLAGAGPMDESGLASIFDRAARRLSVPSAPAEVGAPGYRPPLSIDAFDAWGRPKTQGLRTAGVPQPPSAAGTAAQLASSVLMGGVAPALPAAKAKGDGFLARMVNAVVEAKEAAVNAVMGAVWFDNPAVEALALKSCGLPKEGGFNEAVKVGTLSWLDSTAGAAASNLKALKDSAFGGPEPRHRPLGRGNV